MLADVSDSRSRKQIADVFIDRRRFLVGLVVVVSILLLWAIPRLDMDPSVKSMFSTSSSAYRAFEEFREIFGNDEVILVAIKNERGANDLEILRAVDSLTRELEKIEKVEQVVSLTNLQCFQKVDEEAGNFPVVTRAGDTFVFPRPSQLERISKALPVMDLVVSRDLKTCGVLIRVDDKWRLDQAATRDLITRIHALAQTYVVPGSDYRIVGPAIIRLALQKYAIQSAVIFALLCALICTVVTVYIFKSLKVTFATILILGLSAVWVLGVMAVLRIPLNATTSTTFGLILITTLEIVIHMVVRYNQFRQWTEGRIEAVRETVRFLARPCLISAGTTAVGFGSCMVSGIPMVFQMGLIMSLGIMISWGLAMILTPALLIATTSLDTKARDRMVGDLFTPVLEKMKESIAGHYRLYTISGFAIALLMFSAIPLIRTDQHLLRFLGDSNPEVEDIRFVESTLTGFHALELILEAEPNAFKKPQYWKKVEELEERLREIPEVAATDSFFPVLQQTHGLLKRQAAGEEDLFANPKLIPQLLFLTRLSTEGNRALRRYVEDGYQKMRILVRFRHSPHASVADIVAKIHAAAESVLKDTAKFTVTGELAVLSGQGKEFVKSEIQSMALALGIITILMMIQMGTPLFGLVSLIPNIPPIAAVFGIMGWFGIPLDGATVFAATVAVGLAVDNTIHYVAQLKREIRLNPHLSVEEAVFRAYSLAAKPMAAWSLVTLLGFLALIATPFRASINFGILVSAAVFMGIFGDLIFMQSMILTSPFVRRLIRKVMDKERINQR